jgi:hypothetical protein
MIMEIIKFMVVTAWGRCVTPMAEAKRAVGWCRAMCSLMATRPRSNSDSDSGLWLQSTLVNVILICSPKCKKAHKEDDELKR